MPPLIDAVKNPDKSARIYANGKPPTDPNARINAVTNPDPNARIFAGQQELVQVFRDLKAPPSHPMPATAVPATVGFVFKSPAAGDKLLVQVSFPCRITGYAHLIGDVSGSASPTTVTVTSAAAVTTAAKAAIDTDAAGWLNLDLPRDAILVAEITSVATFGVLLFEVNVMRKDLKGGG
jgi:hypothetical protein